MTLSTFLIQHNHDSNKALARICPQLLAFLAEGVNPGEIRRRAAVETGNGQRYWKVVRAPCNRLLPKIDWQVTIADGAADAADMITYREWVRRRSAFTLKQMDALIG